MASRRRVFLVAFPGGSLTFWGGWVYEASVEGVKMRLNLDRGLFRLSLVVSANLGPICIAR